MKLITVKTPLGLMYFKHERSQVVVDGTAEALQYWRLLIQRADLFGGFGLRFDPKSCMLSDLSNALIGAYGPNNCEWDQEADEQIKQEMTHPKDLLF